MDAQNYNKTDCAKYASAIFPIIKVEKVFFTILFSLYLALSLIYFIWEIEVLRIIPTLLGFLTLAVLFITGEKKKHAPIYLYAGLIVISLVVSSLMVGRSSSQILVPFLLIIPSLGIAMTLIRGYVYSWGGYIVFYGLAIYFFIFIIFGIDVNSSLMTSYNGISIVMLVACISLYIVQSLENKDIDIKPALVTLIISIWGIGRSGIAASLILLLGLTFIRLKSKSKKVFIVLILVSLFSVYLFFENLYLFLLNIPLFSNALETNLIRMAAEKSPRLVLWSNYFDNLDIFRLIFGVNVLEDPWPEGEINEYNYHNSFINFHLQTGFMGLISLVLIVSAVSKFYRTNKIFLVLLITLISRSSTDLFLFFSRFDFIPFFFIFYFIKNTSFCVPHKKTLSAGNGELYVAKRT